jgi:formate-dependent nitrite reductase membrane component NrfD
MAPDPNHRRRLNPLWRAVVEVAFIIFLFYSNLLMGEFVGSAGKSKTLAFALGDIMTPTNFAIGLCAAGIGYGIVEFLRKKL